MPDFNTQINQKVLRPPTFGLSFLWEYILSVLLGNIFELVIGAIPVPWEGERSWDPSSLHGSSTVPVLFSAGFSWQAQFRSRYGLVSSTRLCLSVGMSWVAQPPQRSSMLGEELTLEVLLVTPPRVAWGRKDIVCSGYTTIKVTALPELICYKTLVVKSHFILFLSDYIPKPKPQQILYSANTRFRFMFLFFSLNWSTTAEQFLCLTWKLQSECEELPADTSFHKAAVFWFKGFWAAEDSCRAHTATWEIKKDQGV